MAKQRCVVCGGALRGSDPLRKNCGTRCYRGVQAIAPHAIGKDGNVIVGKLTEDEKFDILVFVRELGRGYKENAV